MEGGAWNRKGTGWGLERTVEAVVRKGERYDAAECLEIAVVTQGLSLDEALANLQEAVPLHLEDEAVSDFGLVPNPTILVRMELEPAGAQA